MAFRLQEIRLIVTYVCLDICFLLLLIQGEVTDVPKHHFTNGQVMEAKLYVFLSSE
jgi:hypothetical protein